MSKNLPGRDQGHLVVAAVRVLTHRNGRLPSTVEVAEILGQAPEAVAVVVRELVGLGALVEVADAYEARLEVGDYLKLEELEAGAGADIVGELRSFAAQKREREAELKKQFGDDFAAKQRQKFSKLEEELKKFRGGGGGPRTNLWGEPVADSEDDE